MRKRTLKISGSILFFLSYYYLHWSYLVYSNKIFKIYFYPLLVIFASVLPWWAFSKYVLKFNFISFLASSTDTSFDNAVFLCIVFISIIYLGWVSLNMWIENSKSIKEKEKRIDMFFLNYGKVFIGIVLSQVLIVICFAIVLMN